MAPIPRHRLQRVLSPQIERASTNTLSPKQRETDLNETVEVLRERVSELEHEERTLTCVCVCVCVCVSVSARESV